MNKTPQDYRIYILDMLVVTLGSWKATGCQDEALEAKAIHLFGEIHPNQETALLELNKHIAREVAA